MHARRKLPLLIVSACLLFQQLAQADPQQALPSADILAPKIHYTPPKQFKLGELARIEATVTDNVGVAEVNLYYMSGISTLNY